MSPFEEGKQAYKSLMDGSREPFCKYKPYTPSYVQYWKGWSEEEEKHFDEKMNAFGTDRA